LLGERARLVVSEKTLLPFFKANWPASLRPRAQAASTWRRSSCSRPLRAKDHFRCPQLISRSTTMWVGRRTRLPSINATLENPHTLRARGDPAEEDGVTGVRRLATARSRRHQRDCSGGSRGVSSGTGGWPGAPCRNVIVAYAPTQEPTAAKAT